jgi:hypothetical protein
VALSFLQKLRLTWRVWSRRRAERAKRRDDDFLRRNAGWGVAAPRQDHPTAEARKSGMVIDRDGLQIALLDDSGRIAHYLDMATGEVIDMALDPPGLADLDTQPDRFKRVPTRGAASELADRRAFVAGLDASPAREELRRAIDVGAEFRRVVARDRALERAWYSFKNDRALAAIDAWLAEFGID